MRKHELYFKQSDCLYLPLTDITGYLEILKDFLKLSKWAKTDFTQDPPTPQPRPLFFGWLCLIFQPIKLKKVSNWSGAHAASNKTVP